ncbi:MAG: CRISPR-associated helicase Cas3' [Tissierellia bacterium]|nr:CRISPR-associated helicase Cas3' [Tissierellia bacterium]
MRYAHIDHKTGKTQSLQDHLLQTGKLAKEYGKPLKLEFTGLLLGIFHDLGKADSKFQDKIRHNRKNRVNHSSAGARFIDELCKNHTWEGLDPRELKYYKEIIMYVITAHHGLYDIPGEDENYDTCNNLFRRCDYDKKEKYSYQEEVVPFAKKLEGELIKRTGYDYQQLFKKAFCEYMELNERLQIVDGVDFNYYRSLFMRLFLSILKNADILDTINAYDERVKPKDSEVDQFKRYYERVEEKYKSFGEATTKLNRIRTDIAEQGKERGKKDLPGVYRLDLPTGAGKTLISLRYGISQCFYQNRNRFIYITPFLSVLEQNATEIKNILQENILEHHSNMVEDIVSSDESFMEEKESVFHEYLIDTWDRPVVLSTMVQFFQTCFKHRSSNIRRFYSLNNAVIILDEVQSLPIEVMYLSNLLMNFLVKVMNATVVHCTATQPNYDADYIKYPVEYGTQDISGDIVLLDDEEREAFRRTRYFVLNEEDRDIFRNISDEIKKRSDHSILIIVNTKSVVKILYEDLLEQNPDRKVYYLSTNQCAKHRQDIIQEIRKDLEEDQPIICVSTQLIEAGVDVDFDTVFRSFAGVDSIIQSGGRCNREARYKYGDVLLMDISNTIEKTQWLKGVHDKKSIAREILSGEKGEISIEDLNDRFYKRYYKRFCEKMVYPLHDGGSLFDILSINRGYSNSALGGAYLRQSFLTASKEFDLIKDEGIGIIIATY